MNKYLHVIKKHLSISLEDIASDNLSTIIKVNEQDTEIKIAKDFSERIHLRDKNESFTGLVMIDDSDIRDNNDDLCIPSQRLYFNGVPLGPEVIDGIWRTNFGGWSDGLTRCVNDRYRKKPFATKGFGVGDKAVMPSVLSLSYFGVDIDIWWSEQYDRLSRGFFDRFIYERLTQKNIIETCEQWSILPWLGDYIEIVKSINNFDSFLNEELENLKREFKDYKQINTISDCANLVFIFNPKFREIYEERFQKIYLFDPEGLERQKRENRRQQEKEKEEKSESKATQTELKFK